MIATDITFKILYFLTSPRPFFLLARRISHKDPQIFQFSLTFLRGQFFPTQNFLTLKAFPPWPFADLLQPCVRRELIL